MADILSAVVGSAGTTNQQNIQDPVTQQMQRERLGQMLALFQGGGLYQFAGSGGDAYQPTSAGNRVYEGAYDLAADLADRPIDYSNLMSLEDYRRSFDPVTQSYQSSLQGLDDRTNAAVQEAGGAYEGARANTAAARAAGLNRSYADYNIGANAAGAAYSNVNRDISSAYNAAIARGDYDLARTLSINAESANAAQAGNFRNYMSMSGENQANATNALLRAESNTNRNLAMNQQTTSDLLTRLQNSTDRTLSENLGNYYRTISAAQGNLGTELGINQSYAQQAQAANDAYAQRAYQTNQSTAQQGLTQNKSDLLRSIGIAEGDAQRSLDVQNLNRQRALDLGMNAAGGYVDQIARPRLEQMYALQGLERGPAAGAAVSRAIAEYAMPYLQSIEVPYGTNQANTLNSLMGIKGGFAGQASAQDAALMQQLLGANANVGTTLMGLQGDVGTTLQNLQAAAAGRSTTNQFAAGQQLSEQQAAVLSQMTGLQFTAGQQLSAQQHAALSQLTGLQGDIGSELMGLQGNLGSQYLNTQSNVLSQLSGQQAQAAQTAAQGNQALGGQRLAATAQSGTTYQNNINQLAQALMANNITLEQAGIAAESALGQQLMQSQAQLRTQQQQGVTSLATNYMDNQASFAQSLPGASTALSMAPLQMQGARAGTLAALQPIADFPRQLQEADLLRRQGLFTAAYTGIPFAPSTTTSGSTETANLFENMFS